MSLSRRPLLLNGSDILELRRRALKRDDALRRRIENDLSKKKRTIPRVTRHRRATPGTVMLLRPLEPVTCKKLLTAYEASQLMAARRENCVLVLDDHALVGIITAKDLAFRIAGAGKVAGMVLVEEIMTSNPICSHSDDPAGEALNLMVERGFRHLPVLGDDGTVVGVLDITKCYAQQMEKLERMHESSKQLYEALDTVHLEMGGSHPLHVFRYFEELRTRLNGPTLDLVLSHETEPIYTTVKLTVYDATVLMNENHTTAVLVKDYQGSVAGIFTSKDVVLRVIAAGLDPKTCLIVRVMTPQPDVLRSLTPIQQALRQMFEGHYLNLPIVSDEDDEIVGIVDVLKLTYATLNQIKQIEQKESPTGLQITLDTSTPTQEPEGPTWNKFWTLYDPNLNDDLDSVHSDSLVATPDVASLEYQRYNFDITPQDSVSQVDPHQPAVSKSYARSGSHSGIIAEEDYGKSQIIFKLRVPGIQDRVYRIPFTPADGTNKLRQAISERLDKIELEAIGGSSYAISYVDDENDTVSITSDRDILECARINLWLGKDVVDLYLHDPSKPARPSKLDAIESKQWIEGISNEVLVLAIGVLAGTILLGYVFSKS